MNTVELRYQTTQFLLRDQYAGVKDAELVSPVAGDPQIHAVVTVTDPYTPGAPLRRFRITFEEIN